MQDEAFLSGNLLTAPFPVSLQSDTTLSKDRFPLYAKRRQRQHRDPIRPAVGVAFGHDDH